MYLKLNHLASPDWLFYLIQPIWTITHPDFAFHVTAQVSKKQAAQVTLSLFQILGNDTHGRKKCAESN